MVQISLLGFVIQPVQLVILRIILIPQIFYVLNATVNVLFVMVLEMLNVVNALMAISWMELVVRQHVQRVNIRILLILKTLYAVPVIASVLLVQELVIKYAQNAHLGAINLS